MNTEHEPGTFTISRAEALGVRQALLVGAAAFAEIERLQGEIQALEGQGGEISHYLHYLRPKLGALPDVHPMPTIVGALITMLPPSVMEGPA